MNSSDFDVTSGHFFFFLKQVRQDSETAARRSIERDRSTRSLESYDFHLKRSRAFSYPPKFALWRRQKSFARYPAFGTFAVFHDRMIQGCSFSGCSVSTTLNVVLSSSCQDVTTYLIFQSSVGWKKSTAQWTQTENSILTGVGFPFSVQISWMNSTSNPVKSCSLSHFAHQNFRVGVLVIFILWMLRVKIEVSTIEDT